MMTEIHAQSARPSSSSTTGTGSGSGSEVGTAAAAAGKKRPMEKGVAFDRKKKDKKKALKRL